MRIAVDARELTGRATGVGRYLGRLLEQWRAAGPRHEFVLYAHRPIDAQAAGFPVRVLEGTGGTVWEQVTLARALARDRPEVLFAPAYTAPLMTRVPTVVTIHDVSFFAHPEWFSTREGGRRRFITRRAAVAARGVVTVSQFSKTEITTRLGVPPERVAVILHGVDRPSQAGNDNGPTAARVLYVGSIFNRRHVPDLIGAIALMARTNPAVSLDIVGDNRTFPPIDVAAAIAQSGASAQIRWHRYVSDVELHTLYRQAGAFAFLSEYEGFGLTPLEAMARGVPSVLFDTPISRESCGDAALYVPLGNIAAIAGAIRSLLFDATVRNGLAAAAPRVLARYDWATAARLTLAAIEGAA